MTTISHLQTEGGFKCTTLGLCVTLSYSSTWETLHVTLRDRSTYPNNRSISLGSLDGVRLSFTSVSFFCVSFTQEWSMT